MNATKSIIGLSIIGGAIYAAIKYGGIGTAQANDTAPTQTNDSIGASDLYSAAGSSFTQSAESDYMTSIKTWVTPKKGMIYEADFIAASLQHGLPAGLLSRMAYQESRYNPKAKSPVGALGLMQFMPATAKDYGIDPYDAKASIYASAKYMASLYTKFGNWKDAVASYNWGQGNVARKGLSKAPLETRNYFTQILTDIGLLA